MRPKSIGSEMVYDEFQPHFFTGRWLGETQGCPMPAHIWEITQTGFGLWIATRWEGENEVSTFFGQPIRGEMAFHISGSKLFKAILIDKQHFVIADWCTNDRRGGVGPDYDVIFSRPGIAELTARQVYRQYLEQIA
jgi:hypothetical protein